jgi:hypothetical protein
VPLPEHRLAGFRRVTAHYQEDVHITESASPVLGLLGAGGVLWLFAVGVLGVLRRRSDDDESDDESEDEGDPPTDEHGPEPRLRFSPATRAVAYVTMAAALLAIGTGFPALAAATVGSPLRAYNRMSIFLEFFALFGIGLGLTVLVRGRFRRLVTLLLPVMVVLAVLDQTSPRLVPGYDLIGQAWNADAAFMDQVRAVTPPNGVVLQLPYLPFPENGSMANMFDYDHLRGWLHDDSLNWVYGAMKGRPGDWMLDLAHLPAEAVMKAASLAGVSGVWVDAAGYRDNGAEALAALRRVAFGPVLNGPGNAIFYARIPAPPPAASALGDKILRPVQPLYGPGFRPWDTNLIISWRPAQGAAVLRLENPLHQARRVRVRVTADSLDLRSNGVVFGQHKTVLVHGTFSTLTAEVDVPAGGGSVTFTPDRLDLPYRIMDLSIVDTDVAAQIGA